LIFAGPTLEFRDDRRDYGETRIGAYGEVSGVVLFVVYTRRGTSRRLISAMKAGTHEREIYHARIAAGGTGEAG
jgi:uncharacterized DUF497 family protein